MMKRLIWKEWREKRLWLLVFFGFVAITTIVSHEGLSFGGRISTMSPWVFMLLIPALLMGLSTFSRETGCECQDFLLSRAIGWKRVLGAKVLVDCGIMLLAIIAGAILYRLLLPSEYVMFASFGKITVGVIIAFGVSLMGYLPGFGASVVLPGVSGGGLVLGLIGIAMSAEAGIIGSIEMAKEDHGTANVPTIWIALFASWAIAIIVTSVIMTKRGLGLSVKERARKYAIYVAVISTAMLLLTVPALRYLNPNQTVISTVTDISPDGRFVLEYSRFSPNGVYMVRRSDAKTVRVDGLGIETDSAYGWFAPDSLVAFRGALSRGGIGLVKERMNDSGHIVRTEASGLLLPGSARILLSPSGHYLANSKRDSETVSPTPGRRRSEIRYVGELCIVDIATMKSIFLEKFPNETIASYRWESDHVLNVQSVARTGRYKSIHKFMLRITPENTVKMELT